MAGGGPAGKAPLVRAVRAKSAEFRKAWVERSTPLAGGAWQVASQWLDRFHEEKYGAIAELIALVLAVADVPSKTTLMKEDLEDHAPQDVITELTAALALEASEKGRGTWSGMCASLVYRPSGTSQACLREEDAWQVPTSRNTGWSLERRVRPGGSCDFHRPCACGVSG